jgi:hypothetical protein
VVCYGLMLGQPASTDPQCDTTQRYTERRNTVVSTPSCSEGPGFRSRSRDRGFS